MDLYGAGVSISQANGLSQEARTLAHQSRDFNGQLAANIDEVKNQKDQESLEQQAINMYKGGTAAHSFAATKEGKNVISGLRGGIQKGGQFLPVSFREKFAREIDESARNPLQATARGDEAVNFNIRQSMRQGASEVGGAGAEGLVDVPLDLPARPAEGFLGSGVAAATEDIPTGVLGGAAQTAEETISAANPLSTFVGGIVRDPSGAIRADTGILDDSVEVSTLTSANDAAQAAEQARQSGLAEGLAASRPAQAGSSVAGAVEPALVETSTQAERTGEFADLATRSGVVEEGLQTSATTAAKTAAEQEGKALLKRTGTKLGLAGVGGGLEIYKDIQRGSVGNNWKQQIGNVGNIIGSGMEIAGVFGAEIPPLGLGLEALGAGVSLVSTAFETAGDIEEGSRSKAEETDQLNMEAKGIGGAQKITTAVGRTQ